MLIKKWLRNGTLLAGLCGFFVLVCSTECLANNWKLDKSFGFGRKGITVVKLKEQGFPRAFVALPDGSFVVASISNKNLRLIGIDSWGKIDRDFGDENFAVTNSEATT
jgi:hypothetical protein